MHPEGLFVTLMDEKEFIGVAQFVSGLEYSMPAPSGRKVVQYGPLYDYDKKKVYGMGPSFPQQLGPLLAVINKFLASVGLAPQAFNQCIINRYQPGEGIAPHSDHRDFGPVIACFTCGAGRIMKFSRSAAKANGGPTLFELYTQPYSLYVMSGPARYEWTHEMPLRKSDVVAGQKIPRGTSISITFRTTL